MARKGTIQPGEPGYWEWRAKTGFVGRPKSFAGPKHLWKLACEYFKRIDERPFLKQEQRRSPVKIDKRVEISDDIMDELRNPVVELKTIRPYTWAGLTDYLNEQGHISTLQDYKANRDNRYTEFVEVIRAINEVMYQQKFEGAASGAFNANIIARDLGLVDKTQTTIKEEQPLFGDEDSGDNTSD